MFKVDKMKKILDCDICNNILIEPISLSCGYTDFRNRRKKYNVSRMS